MFATRRPKQAAPEKERHWGQPVVHFEVIGKDGEKLRDYYAELFGWEIDADNEMNYGVIDRADDGRRRNRRRGRRRAGGL